MGWHYLDTSALVKLFRTEVDSAALRAWARADVRMATSELTRAELVRALRRAGQDVSGVEPLLAGLLILGADASLFREAADLDPVELRTLDAVHLAAARRLQPELAGIVTYDQRLAQAAAAQGIPVVAPADAPSPRRFPPF
ncbi:MAG: type II toxin-antitoxin system VapC family toxin [Bifidobacteriaceae bacterium]|jgi:predicted nucleic acid-binding protein|nr:type II toxin-antitoxin system VapC family toxin [Bifidobacteriaceae bacterium]